MHRHDVKHAWYPSDRMQRLIARVIDIPPLPPDGVSRRAIEVINDRAKLLPKGVSSRLRGIVYRELGDPSWQRLVSLVRGSWVENSEVRGDLAFTRRMGVKLFSDLQRLIGDA